jgi:hypothetical protein
MNKSGVFCKQFYESVKNKANTSLSQVLFQIILKDWIIRMLFYNIY